MKRVGKVFRIIIVFAITAYMPLSAGAWGMLGHRIVGQIAESHLSKRAKKRD